METYVTGVVFFPARRRSCRPSDSVRSYSTINSMISEYFVSCMMCCELVHLLAVDLSLLIQFILLSSITVTVRNVKVQQQQPV